MAWTTLQGLKSRRLKCGHIPKIRSISLPNITHIGTLYDNGVWFEWRHLFPTKTWFTSLHPVQKLKWSPQNIDVQNLEWIIKDAFLKAATKNGFKMNQDFDRNWLFCCCTTTFGSIIDILLTATYLWMKLSRSRAY